MNWVLWLPEEIIYWLWCRWRGHTRFAIKEVNLEKFDNVNDIVSFRVCMGCGRVYEEDVGPVLDELERDLDALEKEIKERNSS